MFKERSTARGWLSHAPRCVLCGAGAPHPCGLCRGCRGDLPSLAGCCERCASPLVAGAVCGRCQRSPPPYQRVYAPFAYQPPVDYLIQGVKYNQRLGYARVLGLLLAEHLLTSRCDRPDVIIPVPLHRRRLRERGYNQALEIARPMAKCLGMPIDTKCCIRTRHTSPQTLLPSRQRQRNLNGAFALLYAPRERHVVLVDDVMTTGSTVTELARLLRRAGVGRVDVWVCCRASLSA